MAWLYLLLASFFEIGFTTFLKLSDGFKRPLATVAFLVFSTISFVLLTFAVKKGIPLGTAYAVWTGIGASGTVLVGILWFNDPCSLARLALLANIVLSVVGLKLIATG